MGTPLGGRQPHRLRVPRAKRLTSTLGSRDFEARTEPRRGFRRNSNYEEPREETVQKNRITIVASLIALFLQASVAAFGAGGDKAKVKGMIKSRTGETLIVKGPDGDTTVVLDDSTRTKDNT